MIKEIFIGLIICLFCLANSSSCNESPGFFLKISKNVPRIGKRGVNGNQEFFMKAAKNVPRIGRRSGEYIDNDMSEETFPTLYDYFTRTTRKVDYSKPKFYNNIRPIDSKHVFSQIASDLVDGSEIKFISWIDLDKAIETDLVLFNKLHSLASSKDVDDLLNLINEKGDGGKLNKLHFVALNDDGGRTIYQEDDENDNLFYRTDRSFDNNFVKINEVGQGGDDERKKMDNRKIRDKFDFQY